MGSWRPATVDEVARLVEAQVPNLTEEHRRVWESIRTDIQPAKITRFGERETVFVVGESDGRAVYWEDVEEGFNISAIDVAGNLVERGCDQDDLSIAIHKWIASARTWFALTPLESALLDLFRGLYGDSGFPDVSELVVIARKNTGAGRFVDFQSLEKQPNLGNGYLDMGGKLISMEGLQDGLMAVAYVRDHRVDHLEIVTYGNVSWDGVERPWMIE